MRVNEGVPIKTDSVVFINTIGFLGDYYLEISTGSQDAPLLPPGSVIQSREIVTFHDVIARAQSAVERLDAALVIINDKILAEHMPELRRRVETITDKMTELLTDADQLFNEQNRKNIGEALAELNALLRENKDDLKETVANFRLASERLESLAGTLDSITQDNRDDVESLIKDIRATADEIRGVADRVGQLVAENAGDIAVTVDNLKAASSNARDFSETISDEPWRLIWRTPHPEEKAIKKETGADVR
jgi:phospholipid/cholesterol/gamma-HCH transport system substrate-binding protein